MVNNVILVGRLTKDPVLKKTANGISVTQFTVAVDRPVNKKNVAPGTQTADFVNTTAWRQPADYLCRYGHKGDIISVEGRIQTRSYDDSTGKKVFVTEVVADRLSLISNRNYNGSPNPNSDPYANNQQYTSPAPQQAPVYNNYGNVPSPNPAPVAPATQTQPTQDMPPINQNYNGYNPGNNGYQPQPAQGQNVNPNVLDISMDDLPF